MGATLAVRAWVALGSLSADDVEVQVVHGRIGSDDVLTATSATLTIPTTGFTKTFTAANEDELEDQIEDFFKKEGADAYAAGRYADGAKMFEEITTSDDFVEFLTLPAYEALE